MKLFLDTRRGSARVWCAGVFVLSTQNFADQSVGAVELFYAFDDCSAVNSNRPSALAFVNIPVAIRQLLYVAVEIQTDELAVAIDDRTARVALGCRREVMDADASRDGRLSVGGPFVIEQLVFLQRRGR